LSSNPLDLLSHGTYSATTISIGSGVEGGSNEGVGGGAIFGGPGHGLVSSGAEIGGLDLVLLLDFLLLLGLFRDNLGKVK